MGESPPVIGVLALQGAFERHAEVLRGLGHEVRLLREPKDFEGLAGLVLPGGESTVQLKLIERQRLAEPFLAVARSRPVLATCAGLILLAKGVTHPEQHSFGLLDVDVARNAWGRQLDSFEAESDGPEPLHLVFIRAPRITRVGPGVEVLAQFHGEPVLVREGNVTAATFHPELGADTRVHETVFGRRGSAS